MTGEHIKPTMIVFAGNNGSGKSTLRNIIFEKHGILTNIDPDALARKYKEHAALRAGKESIRLVQEHIQTQKDFSIETTLSGNLPIKQISKAKQAGFNVIMYYVGVEDIDINISRIAQRVKNGGHHIPTEDVVRRKERSITHLIECLSIVDTLYIVDNTELNAAIIAEMESGILLSKDPDAPVWVENILKYVENCGD
jgi:predicted ABC-type ATPase